MNEKAQRRADRRQQEIITAAARVFGEQGYHEAGVADIADELNIGHGTVYRYFRNKSDLAQRVMDTVVSSIMAALTEGGNESPENLEQFRQQMEGIVGRIFDLANTRPELIRFLHRQAAVDVAMLADAMDSFCQFIEEMLRNGVDKGFLRQDLSITVEAQLMVAAVFDVLRRAATARPSKRDRAEWIASAIELLCRGVGA